MNATTLIVPGFHGSGPAHWQTWLETQLPNTTRVSGIDWEAPILARWASAIRTAIDNQARPVWLVAHSFGCLASIVAAVDRGEKVAGTLLVAPADPERFSPLGLRGPEDTATSLASIVSDIRLPFPSTVIASTNDPWMKLTVATHWANCWGSRFINLGAAGHINIDSGYGPWPEVVEYLRDMENMCASFLVGTVEGNKQHPGRASHLAKLRHATRAEAKY